MKRDEDVWFDTPFTKRNKLVNCYSLSFIGINLAFTSFYWSWSAETKGIIGAVICVFFVGSAPFVEILENRKVMFGNKRMIMMLLAWLIITVICAFSWPLNVTIAIVCIEMSFLILPFVLFIFKLF